MEKVKCFDHYIIEKDHGDIVLNFPIYLDTKRGVLYLKRDCIEDLPSDVQEGDLSTNTWWKLDYSI
jgi:hypothetical protein